jgi:hypothetical protein
MVTERVRFFTDKERGGARGAIKSWAEVCVSISDLLNWTKSHFVPFVCARGARGVNMCQSHHRGSVALISKGQKWKA